jgi:hypothetical protein
VAEWVERGFAVFGSLGKKWMEVLEEDESKISPKTI